MKKKLLERFEELNNGEQSILLALSVVYAPIGQSRFQHLLKRSNCIPVAIANIIAKPLREKLVALELIEITQYGWRCAEAISEILIRKAARSSLFEPLTVELLKDQSHYSYNHYTIDSIKILRIHLHKKNEAAFLNHLQEFEQRHGNYLMATLEDLFFKDFDADWFSQLPINIKLVVLQGYQWNLCLNVEDCTLQYQLMNKAFTEAEQHPESLVYRYIALHLIRGDLDKAETLLRGNDSIEALELMGILRFMQNRYEQALSHFSTALKKLKKETRKRNVCLDDFAGYFYSLVLLQSQTPENLRTLRTHLKIAIKQHQWSSGFALTEERLLKGLDVHQSKIRITDPECGILFEYHNFAYDQLFQALLFYWLGETDRLLDIDPCYLENLNRYCRLAEKNEYFWYASVSSDLLKKLSAADRKSENIAKKCNHAGFNAIIDLLPHVESWQRSLDALTRLGSANSKGLKSEKEQKKRRLIWSLEIDDDEAYLTPKEQRLNKNGRWSKGRPVAVKRLHQNPEDFDFLSEHDRRICTRIEVDYETSYYSYRPKEVCFFGDQAIIEAIGHPNLYWEDAESFDSPVTITRAEFQLLVSEHKNQLHISLSPSPQDDQRFIFEKASANEIRVYQIDEQHGRVSEILGEEGLLVPKSAKQQVIDSIASVASLLTVQSDIGGDASQAEAVKADSKLHVHLQPVGEGIQIDVFVQPFSGGGPVYKPGTGGTTVLAEIDNKALQTTRDLTQEQRNLDRLLENCPTLYNTDDAKWLLGDAEMALDALLQLQALNTFAVLEWPKGKAIKVCRETRFSDVQFSVRKEKGWFNVSGEIRVDDDRVMEMQNLMRLLSARPGRFLKLEDGQIIALTQELRNRLDDLAGLGDPKGKNYRFHPLAAQALDDITADIPVNAGKHWQEHLDKLSGLSSLDPQLPTTMQGHLRDYQVQGYRWLVQLAHLGAGACLADDMGLGKTIQAIALILYRATEGPTLILAPTSVCTNWLEESQRFAPTLNTAYFGTGKRQRLVDQAGPFDVVVCSYGLLQSEAEKLIGKKWRTIVADEAQAIKNPLTQRSKAAMALQGDFKMITTGTPIENHLGELWNLFNFINPGLLGSLKKFNERYAQKIENQNDYATRIRLKKLIQPFILRRLKNDVLTELPARTDVTLHVELSNQERNFYEALRLNAVQSMEETQAMEAPPGQQHLKVLTEIMKLRRACCNPRLVIAGNDIGSAKMQAFEALLDELIANNHKALVFSQFVDHLKLIRELLDQKGLDYQYLDGTTPIRKRKAAVNAFQSGQGDLFLISLKAGGAGLNLTAADYVIHMDPWWNPAVEDQASDRAHRIGQKRPVTIYRLVARDTIEDKIVDLHRHKRDLANSLLEGGELSGKMSVNELLELIKESR